MGIWLFGYLVIWLFGDLVIWGFGYLGICFLLLRSRGFFWNADETDLTDWRGFFLPQITQIFTDFFLDALKYIPTEIASLTGLIGLLDCLD